MLLLPSPFFDAILQNAQKIIMKSEELHGRAENRWWIQMCRGRHKTAWNGSEWSTIVLFWQFPFYCAPRFLLGARPACRPGTIKRKRWDIHSYLNNKIRQSIIHVQKCPARGYQMHFWSLEGYIFTPCLKPVPTIYKRKAGVHRRRIWRQARVHLFTCVHSFWAQFAGSAGRTSGPFWVGIFHKAKTENKRCAPAVAFPLFPLPFWRQFKTPLGLQYHFFSPSWNLTGSLGLFQDYIRGQKMTQATNSPAESPQCKDTAILECVFTDGGIGFSSERPYHFIGFLLTFCFDWQVNSKHFIHFRGKGIKKERAKQVLHIRAPTKRLGYLSRSDVW